jgi:hypothetical protein
LIICSLRIIYRTVGGGLFHCQRCGGDRRYSLKAGRRHLALFRMPVLPLRQADSHIQCRTCRARYHQTALRLPTAAQMQTALTAGSRAAVARMLRAGSPAGPAARQRAIAAVTGAGETGYSGDALDADLGCPAVAGAADLTRLSRQLVVPAREWFLAEIVRIGMADGPLTGAERDAARAIGAGLGMTQAQAVGVISMTEHSAAAG